MAKTLTLNSLSNAQRRYLRRLNVGTIDDAPGIERLLKALADKNLARLASPEGDDTIKVWEITTDGEHLLRFGSVTQE